MPETANLNDDDEDCEFCGGWEAAVTQAAVEYKSNGWDPERSDWVDVPEGYGYVGGPCEGCGRYLDFEEADAAYDDAPGPEAPTGSVRLGRGRYHRVWRSE